LHDTEVAQIAFECHSRSLRLTPPELEPADYTLAPLWTKAGLL
jgi:hypothetical protein